MRNNRLLFLNSPKSFYFTLNFAIFLCKFEQIPYFLIKDDDLNSSSGILKSDLPILTVHFSRDIAILTMRLNFSPTFWTSLVVSRNDRFDFGTNDRENFIVRYPQLYNIRNNPFFVYF
jgi:hypothetical protein